MLPFRRRVLPLLVAVAALAAGPGCGEAGHADEHAHDGPEDEHADEHGAEDHDARTDTHHLAEDRPECEDDVALPADALSRYGIRVEPVREALLAPTIPAPGHLDFPQGAIARIGSAVPGRVARVLVRTGAEVATGDGLLVVSSPQFGEAQSDYLQARSISATTGPAVELARAAHERAQQLYDTVQGVPLNEVRQREAEWRAAERDRDLARAAETAAFQRLLLMGLDEPAIRELERTGAVQASFTITTPIAGRVVDVAVTLGELVDPAGAPLVVVGDLSVLWVIAEVSETRLAEVALGAAVQVRVPALEHGSFAGVVAAVAPVLEASTRTAEVRVELTNPDGRMLPGMFVQVEIESARGDREPTLTVPDAAVLTVNGRPSVFVPVEPGGTQFCRHDVEVGEPVGAWLPVLAGLAAGDEVVVSGVFLLKAELGKASARHEH